MGIQRDLYKAVRAFLLAASDAPPEKVTLGWAKQTRLLPPAISIQPVITGARIGQDEEKVTTSGTGNPVYSSGGEREATIQVTAYDKSVEADGEEVAVDWVQQAFAARARRDIVLLNAANGLAICEVFPLSTVGGLLDTANERVSVREFTCRYKVTSTSATEGVPVSTVQVDYTQDRFKGDPDPFTQTIQSP